MTVEKIVSDELIEEVWGNANFGKSVSKREVIDNALLKAASGYSNGHTAESIIRELGLVDLNRVLTKTGKMYLYATFHRTDI